MTTERNTSWYGLFHLSVVYVVWGGTYLAIRYAVRDGSGFPPFIMAGSRFLVGSVILLAIASLRHQSLRLSRRDAGLLIVSSILLLNGGNGLVSWAEQRAHSGYAALVVGTTPIWTALVEALVDRRRPTTRLIVSLLIGFAGLTVLTLPVLKVGGKSDVLATLALVVAPLSWSVGAVIQQRNPVKLQPLASSAYQQLFCVAGFTLMALAHGESMPNPTAEAWAAWGYLVVFGSVLAFTSFVLALQLLPIPLVMTYAYVNPVIAVYLGWLLLGEPVTRDTFVGTFMILTGVWGVFREKFKR
jgi:drug/metabolite transporter (DMT)-like permease